MVGQCTSIMGWVPIQDSSFECCGCCRFIYTLQKSLLPSGEHPVARIYCVDRLWAHLYYWNFHCDAVSALTCADDSTAVITHVLWFAWGVSLVRAHNHSSRKRATYEFQVRAHFVGHTLTKLTILGKHLTSNPGASPIALHQYTLAKKIHVGMTFCSFKNLFLKTPGLVRIPLKSCDDS